MGRGFGFRAGDKSGFFSLSQDDLLFLLGTLSGFKPSMRESHDDLGMNSSLRPLIKHSMKKSFFIPSIQKSMCSKVEIKSSSVQDCFNLVRHPKWWVSMLKCSYISTKNVTKQHTLGMHCDAIATISIFPDPDREFHNEAWLTHQ